MGVFFGYLGAGMAEVFLHKFEVSGFAQEPGAGRMAQGVEVDVGQAGLFENAVPRGFDVLDPLAFVGKDVVRHFGLGEDELPEFGEKLLRHGFAAVVLRILDFDDDFVADDVFPFEV